MNKSGASTEKKMSDRRFLKTEMLILEAFLKDPFASVAAISRSAHISRPTFYRHHKTVAEIIPNCEKYLLTKFEPILNAFSKRQAAASATQSFRVRPSSPLRKLYHDTIFFIYRHRRIFLVLTSKSDARAFNFLLKNFKLNFQNLNHLPKNADRIFEIFISEASEILFNWSKVNFISQEIDIVLHDLNFLSDSARSRLMPLIHE